MPEQNPKLGKYLIHEVLGRGGFGTVYRATDTTLDRVVALKILDPLLTRDPGFLERFRREAVGAARLEHPNIVPVYEVGEIEGRSFIAMKYLPGRSLDKLLAEGRLPIERTLHILAQVAAALDFAHDKGLTHRDIKPSNIVVGLDEASGDPDHATLTDFGLVRVDDQSVLTTQGQTLGTPAYMAPEQLDVDRQDEVGSASDIYSFAVVAYEMLAGRPPFVGPTPAVMVAHLTKKPPSMTQFNTALSEDAWRALRVALAKNPSARPDSAISIATSLRSTCITPADRPLRSVPAWIWIAVALVSLGATLLVTQLWHPRLQPRVTQTPRAILTGTALPSTPAILLTSTITGIPAADTPGLPTDTATATCSDPPAGIVQFEVSYDEDGAASVTGLTARDVTALFGDSHLLPDVSILKTLQAHNVQTVNLVMDCETIRIYANGSFSHPIVSQRYDECGQPSATAVDPNALETALRSLVSICPPPLESPRNSVEILLHFPISPGVEVFPARWFVSLERVSRTPTVVTTPIRTSAPTPTPIPTNTPVPTELCRGVTKAGSDRNVRDRPDDNAERIGFVAAETPAIILDQTRDKQGKLWYKIQYGSEPFVQQGWILAEFMIEITTCARLP